MQIVTRLKDDWREKNKEERCGRKVFHLFQLGWRKQLDRQPDRATQEDNSWKKEKPIKWTEKHWSITLYNFWISLTENPLRVGSQKGIGKYKMI